MDKKDATDKKEYMKNYRKGKRTHSITLNEEMKKQEDFILKNMNVKYIDIYKKGLDYYEQELKESSSSLAFELKKINNELDNQKKILNEMEKKKELICSKIEKEKESKLDLFYDKLNKPLEAYMKKNNITKRSNVNLTDFYEKYNVTIETAYINSGLKPSIMNLHEEQIRNIILQKLSSLDM